jgi:RNA polymerase sigma factor (sigma-70 family)
MPAQDPHSYRDDSELIQACLNNSQAAWNELVARYARLVYSIPLRQGMSLSDAEDVFQNVFTIASHSLGTLRDQKLLAAWLIRITYRECQHLRRRSPDHGEIPESLASDDAPPEDEVEIWEKQHSVRLALSQLESPCQELLRALFLELPAPSYQTLAERLGIPTGSIGPTRARCLKKLEAILKEMGVDLSG